MERVSMSFGIDFSVIAVLFCGFWLFREPPKARFGNMAAACGLLLAVVLVLTRHDISGPGVVVLAALIGAVPGIALARAVSMIQIPAMIAFQHGAGGIAAFLVSFVELTRPAAASMLPVNEVSGVLGLAVGSLTFSGSMIASAKLAGRMQQAPRVLSRHTLLVVACSLAMLVVGVLSFFLSGGAAMSLYALEILLGACLGFLLASRIGGADMPVLISSLNATAGFAAALCGMVIENRLLIAFGATVAASGSILTYVMCRAMNRDIIRIIFPVYQGDREGDRIVSAARPASPDSRKAAVTAGQSDGSPPFDRALAAISSARSVIIVPGYGMALARAQFRLAELAALLEQRGTEVRYAIHPVAGRMPGHMNVLLAEADVRYEDLLEMEDANPLFAETDVALVVGACDVVNPAAMATEGTPISGMPILLAADARRIVVCNYDRQPGYSGVANLLYDNPRTIMVPGDAGATIGSLLDAIRNQTTQ
ncbi:MAG: NAD(P)(+) transhydrogenase (Re/Si-specific) subunit beta [Desulfobulbaceae bacterium]|nr:MAG: NAD(P)(+) transhydrogenase (Re/Si-specific) subunit beta [Desulfobulbaceae bacterium]